MTTEANSTALDDQDDLFDERQIAFEDRVNVLSFGAGQESLAILYLYAFDSEFRRKYAPGKFMVMMSDTGDEHPSTYQTVEATQRFCEEQNIEFHFLTNDKGFHSKSWPSYREFLRRNNAIGSKAYPKSCTDNLKVQVLYRFLEHWCNEQLGTAKTKKQAIVEYARRNGKIRMILGIAAGEERRMVKDEDATQKWRRESIETVYPLVELGMDRAACQEYIRSIGKQVPYPSNCMLCPFMSEQELLYLYRHFPDDYKEFVELEAAKLKKHSHLPPEKNLGVWGKKTLPEVLEEAKAKYGDWSEEQLHEYKMSHGHCVMSKPGR